MLSEFVDLKWPNNLNSGFISLILRDFPLSSQPFCLEKDRLALSIGKLRSIDGTFEAF
ncbi:unknown protein [Simkania negevensis Z]|uniref:Uncharacterized protein n=1 Tax=Simkania negevensis (strain ATCC VR-1471 / DSM 27360 / Z) TaxID=331113 RepID=F8L666_SIMNZ|nr:unknown protein [Simkania negevensis Z]